MISAKHRINFKKKILYILDMKQTLLLPYLFFLIFAISNFKVFIKCRKTVPRHSARVYFH
jgi:hypothetical protein